jgi:hypothetical protein
MRPCHGVITMLRAGERAFAEEKCVEESQFGHHRRGCDGPTGTTNIASFSANFMPIFGANKSLIETKLLQY